MNPSFPTFRCSLRLVTPAIVSGFDQTQAEIHWASIRGSVRRFHRLIDAGHQREDAVFGGTTAHAGQSLWLLKPSAAVAPAATNAAGLGPQYFTWSLAKQKRGYLQPHPDGGTPITFDLLFRPGATAEDRQRVRDAFWLWSILGGLGARTRRGFGAVELEMHGGSGDPDIAALPRNLDPWLTAIAAELNAMGDRYQVRWPFRWLVGPEHREWNKALGEAAAQMQEYRRPPRNRPQGSVAPEASRFGLPLSVGAGTFIGEKHSRSASSVWVRVARLDRGYRAYVVHMPMPLLPPGEKVSGSGQQWAVPGDHVVQEFMEGMAARPNWREVHWS